MILSLSINQQLEMPPMGPADATTTSQNNGNRKTFCITRRFFVQIVGSLELFGKTGVQAASWSPLNGKTADIFGITDVFQTQPDHTTTAAMLQNAVLHKVSVLEQKNTFPINLGVKIGCIPLDEVSRCGTRYALTAMANAHNTTPMDVFCADTDSQEAVQWRQNYPKYNAQNLEVQGVLQVNNQQYIFVHQDHPVIQVLRINRELINADIDQQAKIDNEWYKITRQVFSTCCQELRQRVLNKVSTRDMNQFGVQIERIGKHNWTDYSHGDEIMSTLDQALLKRNDQQEIASEIEAKIKQPCSYCMRLEVQYEVYA